MAASTVIDKVTDKLVISAVKLEETSTDTFVFRLHYKLTTWIVLLYSVALVTVSHNITCIGGNDYTKEFLELVQDYCWAEGIFSVKRSWNSKSEDQIYTGIRGLPSSKEDKADDYIQYHFYYKWIYSLIVFKIIAFLVPRKIWVHMFENGRLKSICSGLKGLLIMEKKEEERLGYLVDYITSHLGHNGRYSYGLLFCEVLNLLVATAFLYLWDYITGHELSLHALRSLEYLKVPSPSTSGDDPLSLIFPVVGKCIFTKYGASGSVENRDFMCVLPENIINKWAAIFFWFYLMALIVVSFVGLVVRMLFIFSHRLRNAILSGMCHKVSRVDIQLIGNQSSYADWHVLRQLLSNMEPCVTTALLQRLAAKLRDKPNGDAANNV